MLVQPQMRRTSSLIIRRTSSLPKVLSYVTLVLILTWYSYFCNRLQSVSNNLWEYGTLSQNQNQNRNRTSFEHSKKCKLVNKQSTDDVHAKANAHANANANADVHSDSRIRNAQPVILLSRGRSGSSVFWSTISKLTGQRNTAWESTGSNQTHSKIFFEETLQKDPSMGYDWAIEKLCYIQQDRSDITPEAGIVGFQWKPFMNTFHHEYAIEGLRAIAAQKDPIVKIIYLTRNLLDRKASNLRHDASKHKHKHKRDSGSGLNTHEHVSNGGDSISAHCNVGDTECIKKHSQFDHDIVFPTGDALLKWLRKNMNDERTIQKRLEELQIQYVQVSYEELFIKNALDDNGNDNDNSSKAEEWMRVFQFLDLGPKYGLTMADVRASFTMASTHTKSRNETIANYELVKQTLVGTEFEHLLN